MEKLYMNDLAYVDDLGEQSEKYHKEYYNHFGPISGSFSCNMSKEQFNQIFLPITEPMTEMSFCCGRIQKRTHKKRRINKKYAKKYGYKKLMLKGDCSMERGSKGLLTKMRNVKIYLEEE